MADLGLTEKQNNVFLKFKERFQNKELDENQRQFCGRIFQMLFS